MCQCSGSGKATWIYGTRKQTGRICYICRYCGEYWESGGLFGHDHLISEGRRYGRRKVI